MPMNRKLQLILFVLLILNGTINYSQKGDFEYNDVKLENINYSTRSSFSLNPNNIDFLEIDYKTLIRYYNNFDTNYIENGEISLTGLYNKSLNIDINSLTFKLKAKDSTINLNLPLCPESTQKLFVLNEVNLNLQNLEVTKWLVPVIFVISCS